MPLIESRNVVFVAWKLAAQLKLGERQPKLTLGAKAPGHSHSHLGPLNNAWLVFA